MIGVKEICILAIFVAGAAARSKNNQCDSVCAGKMTIECCECIGCHQGMRFGKRSFFPMTVEPKPYSSMQFDYNSRADSASMEEAIRDISAQLDLRPNRILVQNLARQLARFNSEEN
ncbi:unnamed protein product [Caenorhabditis auriculariae]|uniref:Uncharacterized protein n=1 Tax=Caenorhabditis auriculariae TaxID=2777116 RepID=A0A8S1H965_9PELO|nr:unnamed protein product [Caenorhabditis auriculariae]